MRPHEKVSILSEDLPKIALVGNPNVGKSVLFNMLTGRYVAVSNYPGTTVEVVRGERVVGKRKYMVVDTPGVNSLVPMAEDEEVTRNILLKEDIKVVILVVDTKNLSRGVLLAGQLEELGLRYVVALNMWDEARERRIFVDSKRLSELLGAPVVPVIAIQGWGIDKLLSAVENLTSDTTGSDRESASGYGSGAGAEPSKSATGHHIKEKSRWGTGRSIRYDDAVEKTVEKIERLIPPTRLSPRGLAGMLVSGDATLRTWLMGRIGQEKCSLIDALVREVATLYAEPLSSVMMRQRMTRANEIAQECTRREVVEVKELRERLHNIAVHPFWGIVVAIAILIVMYYIVGVFGAGICVDFLEGVVFEQHINAWIRHAFNDIIVWSVIQASMYEDGIPQALFSVLSRLLSFLGVFIAGEYGVITMGITYAVAIVFPIVAVFFLFFGLLEDSGYLPRLAIMMDRVFRLVGLNGRAVLPMVLGLGCGTMAVLTARTLETKKQRLIVTFLLALGVPCSAQLGVIMGVLAPLGLWFFSIWLGVVLATLLIAGILASRLVEGKSSPLIMEIPPLRMPRLGNIVSKIVARLEWYAREALPLFLLATMILFFLDLFGVLEVIERAGSPVVVMLLGLDEEVTGVFLMGFLRRDYAAAGLEDMTRAGELSGIQILVSMVAITLFLPCVAQFIVMINERGWKAAFAIAGLNIGIAIAVGGIVNGVLRGLDISL